MESLEKIVNNLERGKEIEITLNNTGREKQLFYFGNAYCSYEGGPFIVVHKRRVISGGPNNYIFINEESYRLSDIAEIRQLS